MKKLTVLLLLAAFLTGGSASAAADNVWSDENQLNILSQGYVPAETATDDKADLAGWAVKDFEALNRAGLVPLGMIKENLSQQLTRLEYCELIMPLYKILAGVEEIELAGLPYDDCDSPAAAEAYSLGFIATAGEDMFDPTGRISRQDMAVGMITMLETAGIPCSLAADEISAICGYEDFAQADSWAYNAIAKSVANGYISGENKTQLEPHGDATRLQAIAAAGRIYNSFFTEGTLNAPELKIPAADSEVTGSFAVSWKKDNDVKSYNIIVKDINYDCVADISTRGTSALVNADYFVDGETYTIIAAAVYDNGRVCYSEPVSVVYKKPKLTSSQSSATRAAKEARVFDGGLRYQSAEEASANMVTVSVPIWRMGSDGTKYAAKHSLTVNKNLAEDVVAIFTEIFEDPSQFPIKDLGCYNWRNTLGGAQSQHSFGTCIDINSNENYYVSASGNPLTGRLWAPYENPYSITPDGIVVRTFAKYGWLWGGNAWGEGYAKDYMHMTYLGG